MIKALWRSVQRVLKIFSKKSHDSGLSVQGSRAQDIEDAGRYYFKGDVLDHLDDYFEIILALRRCDWRSYCVAAKLGASIVNPNFRVGVGEKMQKYLLANRDMPAMGAVSYPWRHDTESYFPVSFITFFRWDVVPPWVQNSSNRGTVFNVTMFVTLREERRSVPVTFHIAVLKQGKVTLLKERLETAQVLPQKKRRSAKNEGRGKAWISHQRWRYPGNLVMAHTDIVERIGVDKAGDLNTWAADIFLMAVQHYTNANSDVRVRVSNGHLVGAFGVDLLRMPYFFKDRDVRVNVNGRRKRIFHIVRTHERRMKSGKTTYVRSHFRGERRFVWNGYDVNVTMPGKHHNDLLGFDAGMVDLDEDLARRLHNAALTPGHMTKIVDKHINV